MAYIPPKKRRSNPLGPNGRHMLSQLLHLIDSQENVQDLQLTISETGFVLTAYWLTSNGLIMRKKDSAPEDGSIPAMIQVEFRLSRLE